MAPVLREDQLARTEDVTDDTNNNSRTTHAFRESSLADHSQGSRYKPGVDAAIAYVLDAESNRNYNSSANASRNSPFELLSIHTQ